MKRRKFGVVKKLKSTSGETLVEVLASLLVAALAILMLSQAVTSAVRIIDSSGELMEDYYAAENVLAARPNSVSNAWVTTGEATLIVTRRTSSEPVDFGLGNEPVVRYYVNECITGGEVVSYGLNG